MTLTNKLIKGSTLTLAEQGVKLAMMFVTTPLMVIHLGERSYGIWLLALTIIGYLRFLDLGVSFTGTRFLGQALGSEKESRYEQTFLALSYLFNRIGLVALLATLVLSLALPAFLPENALLRETRWIIFGLGITTAIRFWTRIFEVVLKSHVRYDLIGITAIIKTLIQGSAIIFFLKTGHGLTALLTIFIITDVLDQLLLFVFSRLLYPDAKIRLVREKPHQVSELIRYSATAMVTSVGKTLRSGIDPLVVGYVSGPALVPMYSIGARFLTVFTDLINAVFGGNFLAAFSQLDGRNDRDALIRNFLRSIHFSSAISVLGGCFLAILGPPFILRWVGESFTDSGQVLYILLGPTVLSLMQYPVWSFFYSQNKQKWLAIATCAGGAFNIVLSILLSLKIGFFGVVWATFVELLIVFGAVVPFLVSRVCEIGLMSYFGTLVRSSLPIVTIGALFYFGARNFLAPDYPRLAIIGAGLATVSLPVLWWGVFSSKEREHLTNFIFKPKKSSPVP